MTQLDEDVEVLVDKHVEDIDDTDLTQTLLQMRVRRRSRTATARRQTDRLTGRTHVDVTARVNSPSTTDTNVADGSVATVTTNPIPDRTSDSRAARTDRAVE